MMTLAQRVEPHPQVVDTALEEGETVLLHLESTMYYSLDLTPEELHQALPKELKPHQHV
jgi:hypothetical protein